MLLDGAKYCQKVQPLTLNGVQQHHRRQTDRRICDDECCLKSRPRAGDGVGYWEHGQ